MPGVSIRGLCVVSIAFIKVVAHRSWTVSANKKEFPMTTCAKDWTFVLAMIACL